MPSTLRFLSCLAQAKCLARLTRMIDRSFPHGRRQTRRDEGRSGFLASPVVRLTTVCTRPSILHVTHLRHWGLLTDLSDEQVRLVFLSLPI